MKKVDTGLLLKIAAGALVFASFIVDDKRNKLEIKNAVSDYFIEQHDTDSEEEN